MSAQRYRLVLLDPDDETVATPIGDIELAAGRITLLSSEPGFLGFINSLLAEIEAHDGVVIKVPGEARNALEARRYARGDADFLEGLGRWLGGRYGVELQQPDDVRAENVVSL